MDYKEHKQLQQYCEDLEYLLLLAVQQKEISPFEMELFTMWSDPIGYQVGNTRERRLYDAYQGVAGSSRLIAKKFMQELEHKHGELQVQLHA